jgi:hypothetical protein
VAGHEIRLETTARKDAQGRDAGREDRGLSVREEPSQVPKASSASSNAAAASGNARTSVMPMPMCCAPCPGNRNAIEAGIQRSYSPSIDPGRTWRCR